jgi:hypothetical protein
MTAVAHESWRPPTFAAARYLLPLLLLVATGESMAATANEATASSNLGLAFFIVPAQADPVQASDGRCTSQSCGSAQAHAGGASVGVRAAVSSGFSAQPASVSVGATARGELLILGPASAPAFVDTAMWLHFSGKPSGSFAGGNAVGQIGLSADVGGAPGAFGSGSYVESFSYNAQAAAPQAVNMVGSSSLGAVLWQGLHLPVGVPFEISLGLGARVGTTGEATIDLDWMHTASPALDGPVFVLPTGYTVQSADWSVVDNAYCPGGCTAPVPEPAVSVLMLGGALMLAARRTRGGRAGGGRSSWMWCIR